jgi:hypothetical protein
MVGVWERSEYLEDLYVDESIIPKTRIRASGLGNGPVVSFCQYGNEISGSVKW